MSDIVERLMDEWAQFPTKDRETIRLARVLKDAADRIAHLERVQEAADAMREQYVMFAKIYGTGETLLHSVAAYDVLRSEVKS